jgi:hypothetical protein
MGCGEITRGSAYDCDAPLYGGTRARLLLINKDDLSSYTTSTSTPNQITALTLVSGKVAYVFEGFKNSVLPSLEKVTAQSGQALWKHIVNFFVYENTQLWKNTLQKLGNGKFIAIIQNSAIDANSFEVLGIGQGLQLQDGAVNNKNENNGAYNLILASADNQFEAKPPQTFYDGSAYVSTLALLDGYAAIPTITTISDTSIAAAGGDAETITGTYFYGGGSASDVQSVKWVNQSTGAKTSQTGITVASNTSITFSSVALTAGTYKLEIVTSRGTALSSIIVTVS